MAGIKACRLCRSMGKNIIKQDGTWGVLRGQEITGEFMGEMGCARSACQAVLASWGAQREEYERKLILNT